MKAFCDSANVSPVEIQDLLEGHPQLKLGVPVGVGHPTLGEVLVLCAVPLEGEAPDEASLRETGTVVEVDHPERGAYLTVGNPIKLSDSPAEVTRSPLLGEHTDDILESVCGMSREEIEAAKAEGAV